MSLPPATASPTLPPPGELCCYALVALAGVWPALRSGVAAVGDGVDLYGTLWFYWWIKHCLLNLQDPGFTDLFFHPLGKDIFAHTGNNFVDAALSIPFQLLFGFPRYHPVFLALVLFGNALAFRPLARRFAGGAGTGGARFQRLLGPRATLAAFVATALWQSCSYILFEVTCGRATQAFLWFLPLALDRFLALESPGARHRDALLAGLFTALQAITYWFMGHFMALLFLWLAAWALWRTPRRLALLRRYALACAAALLLVAPFLLPMLLGAQSGRVPGLDTGEGGLLDLPASLQNNVSAQLHGYWLMERWGAPLLGYWTWIGALLLALLAGRDRLRWLGACALVLFFSIGPTLPMADGSSLTMHPYLLAYHLVPFLDRLWFPYRCSVLAFLLISLQLGAVLLPIFAALARSGRPRLARWGPLAVALLLIGFNLLEQHRQRCWPFVTRSVEPPQVFRWIGQQGGGLVHLPFGINQTSIIWQTVHGQPMFGGMGENAPLLWPEGFDKRLKNDLIRFLRRCSRSPERARTPSSERSRSALQAEGFRWVVLHRDLVDAESRRRVQSSSRADAFDPQVLAQLPFAATARISEVLGPPVAVEGPLVVWDLADGAEPPPDLLPSERTLSARSWGEEQAPAYEALLREQGRLSGSGWGQRDHNPGAESP